MATNVGHTMYHRGGHADNCFLQTPAMPQYKSRCHSTRRVQVRQNMPLERSRVSDLDVIATSVLAEGAVGTKVKRSNVYIDRWLLEEGKHSTVRLK